MTVATDTVGNVTTASLRTKIVDVQPKSLTIEITGSEGKVEQSIELIGNSGVIEFTRTARVARSKK